MERRKFFFTNEKLIRVFITLLLFNLKINHFSTSNDIMHALEYKLKFNVKFSIFLFSLLNIEQKIVFALEMVVF